MHLGISGEGWAVASGNLSLQVNIVQTSACTWSGSLSVLLQSRTTRLAVSLTTVRHRLRCLARIRLRRPAAVASSQTNSSSSSSQSSQTRSSNSSSSSSSDNDLLVTLTASSGTMTVQVVTKAGVRFFHGSAAITACEKHLLISNDLSFGCAGGFANLGTGGSVFVLPCVGGLPVFPIESSSSANSSSSSSGGTVNGCSGLIFSTLVKFWRIQTAMSARGINTGRWTAARRRTATMTAQ